MGGANDNVPAVETTWRLPHRDPEADGVLAERLGSSRVLAALLRNRGLDDPVAARAWVQPRLRDLSHPYEIADLERGAERLRKAIKDRERIVVYGDYDVDGMTGTVILMNFVHLAGGRCEFKIPNRLKEGYSFNDEAIEHFLAAEEPPGLVLTVDHGTSAVDGIAKLADAGVDVVVTDHHEPPAILPDRAHALINPRRKDDHSPFKSLCGAAVAYKLAWGTAEAFSGQRKLDPAFREFLLDAMGMVSLATVTDVVPLVGENRVLCFHGLRALPVSNNHGLKALLSASRLQRGIVRAAHVAFRIGPRINAAGRMGEAELAIELLTTPDPDRAKTLAKRLETANDRRRSLEKEMMREILALPEIKNHEPGRAICLGRRGWHPGVIGIVAARLVDRFSVPSLVVGLAGDKSRASARSVDGVNVKEVLDDVSEHLIAWGGHAGAAGATVDAQAFPALKIAFEDRASEVHAASGVVPSLDIDLELPFRAIRPELIEELERLAPHGEANPPAMFSTHGVEVAGKPQIIGGERGHLVFHARHDGRTFRAFAPGMRDQRELLRRPGVRVDLAYRLKFDSYADPGAIELEIAALRPSD
ncbi:MAG: single-stranded-DNA-specific exonuclease RecJ [Planctomycetes bacterium]|nr:single-stranded-DNA-specific exonuclease RecJ [Planctomycetota bacterium]